ncbi:type I-E CRISPR-associated protein Cas5/CasD [Comamonas serinivorans]|uniref:Type I-E CRISPR-associated protein Cas5/CasD n=1 Tax=Comamonas serinivorans TaxID=1082851 RepID=A0A1Y0EL92_9BURK|nr:type I-E CRISPR-associated protein Cas5/CasD [Comamonas serinivorans]ARU04405.1 type I-E CRISPR-associated protein Cas5/CasD [Comamonas serinivorans]
MAFLVFQLQAPLAAWGEPAVGEARGTAATPSHSAIVGLLGAALGVDRTDEAGHAALRDGYGVAVALLRSGSLLRDYHTAQVPGRAALKGRPQFTRRQEMAVPKQDLNTILSTRDYRQNAACLVALQAMVPTAMPLEALASALRAPRFVLYLGRRACPPAAPLWPQVVEAASAHAAFNQYAQRFEAARQAAADPKGRIPLEPLDGIERLVFDERVQAGVAADLSTRRKDRLIRRAGWQFGDRTEHVALLPREA